MPKKSSGKRRNKVDPLIQLAERNKKNSIAASQFEKNESQINKNIHDDQQQYRRYASDGDVHILSMGADRLFKEMKRREN